jgi:hypothetical protein
MDCTPGIHKIGPNEEWRLTLKVHLIMHKQIEANHNEGRDDAFPKSSDSCFTINFTCLEHT